MTINFYRPSFVIENISTKSVRLLNIATINPGETVDLYDLVEPREELFEDQILKGLEKPWGDIYVEVVIKKSLKINYINLPSFNYSLVSPTNINAINAFSPGQVPVAINNEQFEWLSSSVLVNPPLTISPGGAITLLPATNSQDGYITKEDYALFSASLKRSQKIWQFQDFIAPVGTSLTLSSFQNGTGLSFNSSYIVDSTAAIVKTSDINSPPTSTNTFPANLLPSNRVNVTSHIGTIVTLNQAPAASQSVRLYYLISVPANVPLPIDYQEDPEFLNDVSNQYLDNNYVNQNADEIVYGQKTFDSKTIFTNSIQIPTGAVYGYVLKSDSSGNAAWFPESGGGGGGSGDGYWGLNGTNIYNRNIGSVSIGTLTPDTNAKLDVRATDKGVLIPRLNTTQRNLIGTNGLLIYNTDQSRVNVYDGPRATWVDTSFPYARNAPPPSPFNGQAWFNTNDNAIYVYDATRNKWLSDRTINVGAGRKNTKTSDLYLYTYDSAPTSICPFIMPFKATLVSMSASCEFPSSWIAEVRIGEVVVSGATLTVSSSNYAYSNSYNIDFIEGDAIQIYLNGSNISHPRVELIFCKRGI